MQSYPFHPVSEIFPLLEGEDFDSLSADIKDNGLRHPILLAKHNDKEAIADGRNRYRACKAAGVMPRFVVYDPKAHGDSLTGYVISANLHRRQLTTSQRAMVAAKSLTHYQEEARARQQATQAKPGEKVGAKVPAKAEPAKGKKGGTPKAGSKASANLRSPENKGKSTEKAAASSRVSARAIEKAKTVVEKGTPELQAAVVAGKVSVSDAASVVKESPAAQVAAVVAVEEGKAKTVKAAAAKLKPREPGDDSDEEEKIKKQFAAIGTHWGKAVRMVDELGKELGDKLRAEQCIGKADHFTKALKMWEREAMGGKLTEEDKKVLA